MTDHATCLHAKHAARSSSMAKHSNTAHGLKHAYLVKVCGQPVHDHVESIMKGEVVDDDGPDGRLTQHAQPGGGWGASLLLRFSRSQWDCGQPAKMSAALSLSVSLCSLLCKVTFICVTAFTHTEIS